MRTTVWVFSAIALVARASSAEIGDVVVANYQSSSVARFNGETGAYLGSFVPPGSGGLSGATGLEFGPDGNLYVASSNNNRVLRYDGQTGAPLGIAAQHAQLSGPFGIAFGPDGNLYVGSGFNSRVLRFNPQTGEFLNFAAADPTLSAPIGMSFGVDGSLLVASYSNDRILRFDPENGALTQTFELGHGLDRPVALAVDEQQRLYVSNGIDQKVLRYDLVSGAYLDVFGGLPALGGATGPFYGLAFNLDGELIMSDSGRNRLFRLPVDGGEASPFASQGLAQPELIAVRVPEPSALLSAVALWIAVASRRRRGAARASLEVSSVQ